MSVRKKGGKTKREKLGYPKREKHYVPDEYDELLLEAELEKLGKNLDDDGRPKPLSEKHLLNICVSAVRQKWMFCNNKLHFLNSKVIFDTDPNTKTSKLWECNHCKKRYPLSKTVNKKSVTLMNVDHKNVTVSPNSLENFKEWASQILNAGGDKDLQMLCVPCHEIKNVMDNRGITDWDEGYKIKKCIGYLSKPAQEQKDELKSLGFSDEDIKNTKSREACYMKLIEEGRL